MNKPAKQTVRSLLSMDNVKAKFQDVLKDKAAGFTANLAVMVNNNAALSKCDPMSIISAAVVSASLDLPLDPNLGFAAIVPYKCKVKGDNGQDTWIDKAQFQMMYKGFVQLAMRSGQYQTIGATPIYEGQLVAENPLTGEYIFDFTIKSSKIIGYAAYFKLVNGFEKTVYWDIDKIKSHGLKYSKSFAKSYGLWVDDFDSMAIKTILKLLLSKWGILSIEMQKAVKLDQSVVNSDESVEDIDYIDSSSPELEEGKTPLDKKEDLKNKKSSQGKIEMP
jgi:recombination protein RecT